MAVIWRFLALFIVKLSSFNLARVFKIPTLLGGKLRFAVIWRWRTEILNWYVIQNGQLFLHVPDMGQRCHLK